MSNIPSSLSVRIWPFQGRGRGSIPRRGNLFSFSHAGGHQQIIVDISYQLDIRIMNWKLRLAAVVCSDINSHRASCRL